MSDIKTTKDCVHNFNNSNSIADDFTIAKKIDNHIYEKNIHSLFEVNLLSVVCHMHCFIWCESPCMLNIMHSAIIMIFNDNSSDLEILIDKNKKILNFEHAEITIKKIAYYFKAQKSIDLIDRLSS